MPPSCSDSCSSPRRVLHANRALRRGAPVCPSLSCSLILCLRPAAMPAVLQGGFFMRIRFFGLGLLLAALPALASAQPSELFFSEYVEGSSNNKAIEVYNGTASAVDLGLAGYNIQMHFNGNTAPGLTINLSGVVASGDVFVLAQSAADPAVLALADQLSAASWFNGDDAVILRKGTTVIDSLGQVGTDPGTEWGSGLISTADNTLRRKSLVCLGGTNTTDAFEPSGSSARLVPHPLHALLSP